MKMWKRILLCTGLLVLHYVLIFLPLAEMFIVYIILFNPRWFRRFLKNMDQPAGENLNTA